MSFALVFIKPSATVAGPREFLPPLCVLTSLTSTLHCSLSLEWN